MNKAQEEIIKVLERFRDELNAIRIEIGRNSTLKYINTDTMEDVIDWHNRLERFLEENGLYKEARKLTQIPFPKTSWGKEPISSIDAHLIFIKETVIEMKSNQDKGQAPDSGIQSTKVFIVHGHDEANLLKLKDLLKERYRLDCIIMAKQPGKGRTLIEKFEQEANEAGFAFALMTPDDLVKVEGKNKYAQARPNVIFELGWFYGKLGRDRVCILFKEGTEIHSDLKGISQIRFKESVEEKVLEIEEELRAAGLIKN